MVTANGDANLIDLQWKDANGGTYNWHVYVPPDTTTFRFPEDSTSIAAQAPAQTSTNHGVNVAQHGLEPLDGFAAFHLAPPIDYSNPFEMPLGFNTWVYDNN